MSSILAFLLFLLLFSWWQSPSGKHQMDILKLQKKKDLNMSKEISKLSTFQDYKIVSCFPQCSSSVYLSSPQLHCCSSTLGREPMGKVRKTISILGVSRRPEKIVLSVQLPGVISHPPIVFENRSWLPLIYIHVCIVFNIRNSSDDDI